MHRRMTGRYERVEVITGVARRRRWSAEEELGNCEPGSHQEDVLKRDKRRAEAFLEIKHGGSS